MKFLILFGVVALGGWQLTRWRAARTAPDLTHRRAPIAWSGTEWKGLAK